MKRITHSWLRALALSMAGLLAVPVLEAATTVVHDGINYTISGTKATVKRYNFVSGGDTAFYKGDIVIPETFTEGGKTYTVVAVGANAFVDCKELTSLSLPNTCVTINRNAFKGCSSLKNDPVPSTATTIGNAYLQGCSSITEVTVPAGVSGTFVSQNWEGMTSLKKITFADSSTPFKMNLLAFTTDVTKASEDPIEEIYFGRDIDASLYANNQQPFHNMKYLKKVTFGGGATAISGSMLLGCTALETVEFAQGNKIASIGASAFQGCTSLKSIALPEAVKTVEASTFANCSSLNSVTLGSAVTSIGESAFKGTALTGIALPATITSIGGSAFKNSALAGEFTLPSGLTALGSEALAGTALTGVVIPASLTSIGDAALAPIATLAKIEVDGGNTAFKLENGVLLSADGTRLLVTTHEKAGMPESYSNATVTSIDKYGLAYAPFKTVALPALTKIGDYGFAQSKLESFTLESNVTVGLNVFNGSALKSVVIAEGRNEISQGLFANCQSLTSVKLPNSATNMMKNCFDKCTSLKEMEIPANVNYMEPGSVPSTIQTLRVLNVNTPALAAGTFTADQSSVTCKVAENSVSAYKKASQWSYLNIVGDPSISGVASNLGCPTGLYFATADGKLMFKDESGNVVDTKFATGAHAFTLQSYKNRIYVADAGEKFTYQTPDSPLGDGQLFYVNKSGDYFYRVTVLNNVGYKPSEDPFSMSIDSASNTIYISDRNVGVHKLNADTTGLYGSQPFLFQNQYLPYYNDQISWGSITGAFQKDSKGIYWMTKKFNGLGLLRFTDADIYPDGGAGKTQHFKCVFKDALIKTAYLDEKNGYYYMFVQKDPYGAVPGVYRIALSKLEKADGSDADGVEDLKIADCQLIDNSPVKVDGTPDSGENSNIAQINGDGTNVFWGYVAPATDAEAIAGSVKLDATNPLHKSGIKTIKSADATPAVTFAVEGVEAYGVCGATYVAPPVVLPEAIALNHNTYTLDKGGDQLQLTATITPADAADKSVTWSSSDETVATVDANGLVTTKAQEKNTVTIYAVSNAVPTLKDSCVITITNPTAAVFPESISLNITEYTAERNGGTLQLVATVLPENTTNKHVTWSSSNDYATVDANGLVTIKSLIAGVKGLNAEGTAPSVTITATSVANPALSATCVITYSQETGVDNVTASKTVKSVRYYNAAGMESDKAFDGINMVVTYYTDGTKSVSKGVYTTK